MHLLGFWVLQCTSGATVHCTCLLSGFCNALRASQCSALAFFLAFAMHFRRARAVHLLDFWLLQCTSGELVQCTCLISGFRNALPASQCSALALFLASAMHFRRAHAVHLPFFWLLQCTSGEHMQCTCLISGFSNALRASTCSALALFLASAMHFGRVNAVHLLDFWLPQCTSGESMQCTCLISGFRNALYNRKINKKVDKFVLLR